MFIETALMAAYFTVLLVSISKILESLENLTKLCWESPKKDFLYSLVELHHPPPSIMLGKQEYDFHQGPDHTVK